MSDQVQCQLYVLCLESLHSDFYVRGSNFGESRGLGKILISICSWLVMIWEVVSAFDVVNDLVADSVPHADGLLDLT